MSPGREVDRIVVVVPVRDEETLLARCLDGLTTASRHVPVQVQVVVVLDRCTDGSENVARSRPGVEIVHSTAGLVGAARRIGVDHVLARTGVEPERLLLASTDADSVVPPHWLSHLHRLVLDGADAVLGTVQPDLDGLPTAALRAWSRAYQQSDGHPHVHGANLAVRGDVYVAAGGFPPVAAHEDVLLVRALQPLAARVVRSGGCTVETSSRLDGRAPAGFAADLAALVIGTRGRVVAEAGPGTLGA